jgi:hypothetical protein
MKPSSSRSTQSIAFSIGSPCYVQCATNLVIVACAYI